MNILLIEDDQNLCEMVRFQLQHEKHHVDLCHDGRDGLDLLLQDAHDIVLLDRMLPVMNGLSVLKKARAAGIKTPAILVTALGGLYDRIEGLDEYTRGYIEGVMASQMLVYGCNFVEETLSPAIMENLQKAMPLDTNIGGLETPGYTYANYFLCRKITQTERTEILDGISRRFKDITIKLYTPKETPFLQNIQNMGTVHYMYEMPLVFQNSKINLNITLRSIKNGIPLRAMDIMGAGGFLLTNCQNDFDRHFIDGEDFASYSCREDLYNKIQYYLKHDDERRDIARNGCKRVREEHTYEKRVEEMLGTI